jgi:hypothetical protein
MRARRPTPARLGVSIKLVLVLVLFLVADQTAWASARAPARPLLGRRIDRLVAGATRLFAMRGQEVVTFDDAGQPVQRCGNLAAPPEREARASIGAPDAEEVLRAAGLPDDDSTPEAEDALEDEGLGPRRRTRQSPELGVEARAVAATHAADAVWIATSSGVFRDDGSGCAPAGLAGRDLFLVASSGDVVVSASEDLLFRRELSAEGPQEPYEEPGQQEPPETAEGASSTFTVVAGLTTRPRALAVGAAGEAIVADDDGVLVVDAGGVPARILDRPSNAVAVCDGMTAVLASDGVYSWRPGVPPTRVGDRPPARALACGRGAAERWIATGLGTWTSADGARWVERRETLGRSIAGAAVLGNRLWLAAEDGLIAVDAIGVTDEPSTEPAAEMATSESGDSPADPGLPALRTRRWVAPTVPWPWLTAMVGAEETPLRRVHTFMVLLTFPLGRAGGRRADPTALAAELVERDRALGQEQADLRAAARGDDEGDEIDARLAAVRQEREALR